MEICISMKIKFNILKGGDKMESTKLIRYLPWPIKGRTFVPVLEMVAKKNGITTYQVIGNENLFTEDE